MCYLKVELTPFENVTVLLCTTLNKSEFITLMFLCPALGNNVIDRNIVGQMVQDISS